MASIIKDGDVESAVSNVNKVAPDVNQDTEGCHVVTKTDHSTDDVPSLSPTSSSSSSTTSSTSTHKKTKGKDYAEISPNKRYIRFKERFSNTANIKASYRGFDTKNGIEVVWQKIYLSDLGEAEQEPIMRSLNYLKDIQQKHIVEYLSVWVTEAPRTVNLITTYLDPLETFIAKVKTLRWRIIKKWCKQLLTGLHYLHSSNPVIVHRNLNLGNIFMNGGLGEIYLGGLWLSAVLVEGEESVSMSDLVSTYCYQGRQPGSPAYKAPEVLMNQPLTTKVDIYSFGMCLLVLLTKEDPYIEIYGAHLNNESGDSDGHTSNDRKFGYDAIASLIRKGVLPKALDRVSEAKSEAGAFLRSCLALDPQDRKSAEELLEDDFLQQSSGDGGDDNVVIKKMIDEFPMDDVGSVVKENEDISMSDRSNERNDLSAVNDAVTDCHHVDSSTVVVVPLPDLGPPENISQSPTNKTTTIMSNIVIPSLEANDNHVSFSETSTDQGIDVITSKSDNSLESSLVVDEKSIIGLKGEAEQSSDHIETFNDKLVSKLDDSNISSEVSPHLESASHVAKRMSLVNELAKLGTSDDVNDDRGIHDGRRARNSSEKNKSTKDVKTPKQLPVQSAMNSNESSHPTTSEEESKESASAVLVQLHIHGRYTSDGINKEVEFVFDKGSDQVEVIASEMKDELHLNLSVERLVSLIHEEISQSETRRMSDPIPHSPEGTNCQTTVSSKTESSPESNKFDYQAGEISDVLKKKAESERIAVVLSSHGSPRQGNVDANEVSSMVSLSLSKSNSNDDDTGDHIVTELQSKIVEQVVNLGVNIDHQSMNDNADSSITNNIVHQNAGSEPVSPNLKSQDGVPLSISPTNLSVSRVEVPMPDEDALPEELADYHIYVKEIEAIEKESRAARRVFEQRIQKHKIIQMTCEEDLQKMELDYSTQQSKLLNKKSAAEKKKTDELTRLRSELDKNLLELKHDIAKRRLHRKMQFQFRQEDMVQQPLFVESNEYGPTDSFVGSTHSVEGEPKPFTSTENIDRHVVETGVTTSSATSTGGSVDSDNGHSPDIRKQNIPQIHDHDVQYIHVSGGGNYREEGYGRNGSSSSSSSSSSSDSSRRSSGSDKAGQKVLGEKEFVDGDGNSSVCTKGNDLSVIVDNSAGV